MADKKHMNMSTKKRIGNIISYVLLVLISVIWITPFVFLVLKSFDVENPGVTSNVIPKAFGFDNYAYLFSSECNFLQWYFNTFIIALVVCVVQTAMQFAMSFVLSRFRFKLRKPMMNFMLVLGMFPGFLTMIVLYQILKMVNLTGGGPTSQDYFGNAGKTDLLITWLFSLAVNDSNYKLAAVIGIMVFIVVAGLSLVVYNLIPSTKNEEGFQ